MVIHEMLIKFDTVKLFAAAHNLNVDFPTFSLNFTAVAAALYLCMNYAPNLSRLRSNSFSK